jgi:putative nucleotidyltransferase with HDIG domain
LIERSWETVQRGDVLLRIAICFVAAVVLWLVTGVWQPPFGYRKGDIPTRDVVARVTFETEDRAGTEAARRDAMATVECVYRHDPQPLGELRQALLDQVFHLLRAESFQSVDSKVWAEFSIHDTAAQDAMRFGDAVTAGLAHLAMETPGIPGLPAFTRQLADVVHRSAEFDRFKLAFANDAELKSFSMALAASMAEYDQHGLLVSLQHGVGKGSQVRIQVYPDGKPDFRRSYDVDRIRIAQAAPRLKESLQQALSSKELAAGVFSWLEKRLPKTLTLDRELTEREAEKAAQQVPPRMVTLQRGETTLARASEPITEELHAMLRLEHQEFIRQLDGYQLLAFSMSKFGMYLALYVLCGFYIYFRHHEILDDLAVFTKLVLLVVTTIAASWFAAESRFELIPLLLFSMTIVIVHKQELALLLSASVAMATVISRGYSLAELVTVIASMSTAILLLQDVRSRTKLIYVGLWTAAATFASSVGVSVAFSEMLDLNLIRNAAWFAGCAVAAGLLMTGLLPFIERFFNVQTDLSLLELGDVAHPLLQELVRRAPGTYNHSINVASIAQAAAESIGANGLLVRVGAYFHDIGKMLKPQYFVENQSGGNRHESLVPAMSTLVIIAHVKDGADLARQHNLPDSIIDFILQHHGTTLVEFFYHRANKLQKESDPDAEDIDEVGYRYPGPKPQTKEAAVLMLADAVESAGRALVDPTPARIDSLVEEIAMKKLLDDQFDECGLTLKELRTVQESLIKSLTAVYHGRIKYPDQQSA